jgi:hypothetical protein
VQRELKEVIAEVLGKLTGRRVRDARAVSGSAKKDRRENTVGPNRDRLTVGMDLGDRWSQYCILGLEGETLAEGQLRTTQEDVQNVGNRITTVQNSQRNLKSAGAKSPVGVRFPLPAPANLCVVNDLRFCLRA